MTADEEDIRASLKILLGTAVGERFMNPKYGSGYARNALRTNGYHGKNRLVKDRIKYAILIYEPRINLISLSLDSSAELEGRISIILDYVTRSTNSRYNLVFPFYTTGQQRSSKTVDFNNS